MGSEREKERGKRGFMRAVSLFIVNKRNLNRWVQRTRRRRGAFKGEMVGSGGGVPNRSYNNRVITASYNNNRVAIVPPDIMGELLGSSPRGRPSTDPKRAQNREFYVGLGRGGEVADSKSFIRFPFSVDMRLELVREKG